jgi:predicted permease
MTLVRTLLIPVVTGVLFGIAPALQVTGSDVATTLKDGGRGGVGASRAHQRPRRLLVVAEVALALVLLVCAALCARGLRQAQEVDVGFKTDGVVTADLQIGMNGYNATTGLPFYKELRQRLATAPGVEEAALASWFPLGLFGCKGTGVEVEGYQRPPSENPTYEFAIISPRYFATMRIPLVAGRDFTDADDAGAERVAIVKENFARRFWPGQDPIGRRFRSGGAWRTVVGVAKAGKYNRIDEEPGMFLYLPYLQGVPDLDLNVCVRGAADAATLAGIVRATVREIDPAVELLTIRTLANYSGAVFFPHRMASQVLLLLGAVALLLAAMGVHAVIAYAVSQRTKEFAVRMALGAQPKDLLTDVVRQGMVLAGLGIGVGALLAVLASRLLRGFLFGVSPFDPATYLAIAGLLLAVAILACVLPARRAMRVEPVDALRLE